MAQGRRREAGGTGAGGPVIRGHRVTMNSVGDGVGQTWLAPHFLVTGCVSLASLGTSLGPYFLIC